MSLYRRHPADPTRWFSAGEIARARAYRRPLRRAALAEAAVMTGGLAALAGTQAAPRLLGALGVSDWRVGVVVVATGLVAAGTLAGAPFGLWRTFVHERRWSFNRQTALGWTGDLAKGFVIEAPIAGLLLLGLWAAIRMTPSGWLLAWGGSVAFSAVMTSVAPVMLAPLFNTFRPAPDDGLRARAAELGRRAGLVIADVLVVDASRRTTKHNAYFAGLGRTKRVVLWDNLLADFDRPSVESVLAHEIGHWRRRHVALGLVAAAAVSLPAFAALPGVLGAPGAQAWAGAPGPADPGAIPLALLVFAAVELAAAPVRLWLSRAWERQADLDALELTGDPDAFVRMERELALRNLSDVAPSPVAYLAATHPPAPERIALAEAWRTGRPPGAGVMAGPMAGEDN